ncbi:hypothetical protein [Streptomyces sp. NPDC020742]|uniref:hypothetical protein n=1 Tax=unclassified Streptomyces TaxID=2593676 RepID=UPI00340FB2A9
MSEIAKTTGAPTGGDVHSFPRPEPDAHEAYSFACMKCGHGWEQAYEIVHQADTKGDVHAVYYADDERVPSPLTHPGCLNCGSTVVRIMRSGQVSMVSDAIAHLHQRRPDGAKGDKQDRKKAPAARAEAPGGSTAEGGAESGRHHWHLSDLLHPFQHHRK